MTKTKGPALAEREKQEAFERLPVPKSLAYFIIPTVLSQIAAILLNLADSFFIGRTDDPYQVAAMGQRKDEQRVKEDVQHGGQRHAEARDLPLALR